MNGAAHVTAGLVSGIGGVLYTGHTEQRKISLSEVIGGALGGVVGGKLPDVFEPATSSYHRKFAHSLVATGGLLYAGQYWLRDLRVSLSAYAQKLDRLSQASAHSLERFLLNIASWLVQAGSGFVTGVVAGYVSHIVLDAFTPRGVPVFGFTHAC